MINLMHLMLKEHFAKRAVIVIQLICKKYLYINSKICEKETCNSLCVKSELGDENV